ncbi:MAG: oligosaccharide flippase family protein [Bacteroidetes bacterium]|nr:oligosaccharide flippase family protein [Bacteroidota bacterium]
MQKKLFRDISASTLQVLFNQVLGLLLFIITSRFLSKPVYGEFSWSLAVITFIVTILSLRLEQIVVRSIAAGEAPQRMLSLFSGHTILFGTGFLIVLLVINFIFPAFFKLHHLLLAISISQLLLFLALPFKQVVNGKEHFALLAVISSVSNLLRVLLLLWLVFFRTMDIDQVLIIYIISALAELIACFTAVQWRLKIHLQLKWKKDAYTAFLKASLPQIAVVFLSACMARFDWILLGIFTTTTITAEYSFAYRVFELCPFPLLIISPVLLSRFSRYFATHSENDLLQNKALLAIYIRYAMIASTIIPLVLNIVWAPLVDTITAGKYGAVNKTTFLLLSCCIPFQYMVNLFWTIAFAQNRLHTILRMTAITSAVIIAGDCCAIPFLKAQGAAMVYLVAAVVEYVLYLRGSVLKQLKESWQPLLLCVCAAFIAGIAVTYWNGHVLIQALLGVLIYGVLLAATSQAKINDWRMLLNNLKTSSTIL